MSLPHFKPQSSFARKVPLSGEDLSRKGAKAQSATAFLKDFFAPLRLCARDHSSSIDAFRYFSGKAPQSHRFRVFLSILLLLVSGALILAHWKRADVPSAAATGISAPQSSPTPLQAELITITPTGFEPAEITRPQGEFLFAIDNRSGLDDVVLYLERETGGRVNVPLTRRRKLAWREIIDLPPGTYLLRATNDESWRCRISITAR